MPKLNRKAQSEPETTRVRSAQWWRAKEEGKEPHEMLKPLLDSIQKDQVTRYEAYRQWIRALDQDMSAVDGTDISFRLIFGSDLTINEALNTLETLHAQIFKNKIVPAAVPSEGDYEQHFQAMAFGRWLEGAFDDANLFEEVVPQFGWDTIWAGTGIIKAYGKDLGHGKGKVMYDAVSPRFLFVDKIEARHGKPRSIHHKMHLDRWVVSDTYADTPEKRQKVLESKQYDDNDTDFNIMGDGDQVTVWESWHLPSGPDTDDGKHVIWMGTCTLDERPWKHNRFPLTFARFGQRAGGFWGQSAMGRLAPAQKTLDNYTKAVDEAIKTLGVPKLLYRKDCGLAKAQIDDLPFSIYEVENPNQDIREWNAEPISESVIRERDRITQRMGATIGVSSFESQNAIPNNIRDGAAAYMDRAVEQGNARHAMLHRQYEAAMCDIADLTLLVATDLEKDGLDVITRAPGSMKTTVEMLKFSEVKLQREQLKLRVIPVSQLPRTFANRLKDLALLRDRGDITQKTFLRLLEIPDIEAEIDSYTSDEDIIKRNLDYMLRTSKYVPPLPYDNHDMIVKFTAMKINEARCRDVSEDKISLLIQYIEDALSLKNGIGPAPAPAGQLPVGGPIPGPAPMQTPPMAATGPVMPPPAPMPG